MMCKYTLITSAFMVSFFGRLLYSDVSKHYGTELNNGVWYGMEYHYALHCIALYLSYHMLYHIILYHIILHHPVYNHYNDKDFSYLHL